MPSIPIEDDPTGTGTDTGSGTGSGTGTGTGTGGSGTGTGSGTGGSGTGTTGSTYTTSGYASGPLVPDVEVRFRDRLTGLRLFFDPSHLISLDISMTEAGGLDTMRVGVAEQFDSAFAPPEGCIVEAICLTDPVPTGRTEPWPRWRGLLSSPEATLDLTETRSLLVYGLMEDMTHVPLDLTLAAGGGADLAVYAQQVLEAYVAARPWLSGNYETLIESSGVVRDLIDVTRSDCRRALDAIVAQAPGALCWGWRVSSSTGGWQFVFRPKTAVVGYQEAVGQSVRVYSRPRELNKVVNAMRLTGGKSPYPNLLGSVTGDNTAFEQVEPRGYQFGANLVPDPDFNSRDTTYTTRYGGASFKAGGLSEGPTYGSSGSMIDLDNDSGTIEGVVKRKHGLASQLAALAGQSITFSAFCRRQYGTDTRGGLLIARWTDNGGNVIGGDAATITVAPATAGSFVEFKVTATVPSGVGGYELEVQSDGTSDTGSLLVGYMAVYDGRALQPSGWECRALGSSLFTTVDPAYPDSWTGDLGGRRCLRVAGTFSDIDGGDGALEPRNYSKFPVSGNQTLLMVARLKIPPTSAGNGKMFLEIRSFASDGTNSDIYKHTLVLNPGDVPADGSWHEYTCQLTVPPDAVQAIAYLTFRGNTDILVDALQVRDLAGGTEFIRGDKWERRVLAEDVCTMGTDAYNSFTLYDRREAFVSNDSLTTWDASTPQGQQAQQWALGYFSQAAVIPARARLQLIRDGADRQPLSYPSPLSGTQVRIVGTSQIIPDDWPAKTDLSWRGQGWEVSCDLGEERANLSRVIAAALNPI